MTLESGVASPLRVSAGSTFAVVSQVGGTGPEMPTAWDSKEPRPTDCVPSIPEVFFI